MYMCIYYVCYVSFFLCFNTIFIYVIKENFQNVLNPKKKIKIKFNLIC